MAYCTPSADTAPRRFRFYVGAYPQQHHIEIFRRPVRVCTPNDGDLTPTGIISTGAFSSQPQRAGLHARVSVISPRPTAITSERACHARPEFPDAARKIHPAGPTRPRATANPDFNSERQVGERFGMIDAAVPPSVSEPSSPGSSRQLEWQWLHA